MGQVPGPAEGGANGAFLAALRLHGPAHDGACAAWGQAGTPTARGKTRASHSVVDLRVGPHLLVIVSIYRGAILGTIV